MAIYSWFTHWKWWFSIVMLVYQRVYIYIYIHTLPGLLRIIITHGRETYQQTTISWDGKTGYFWWLIWGGRVLFYPWIGHHLAKSSAWQNCFCFFCMLVFLHAEKHRVLTVQLWNCSGNQSCLTSNLAMDHPPFFLQPISTRVWRDSDYIDMWEKHVYIHIYTYKIQNPPDMAHPPFTVVFVQPDTRSKADRIAAAGHGWAWPRTS